MRVTIEIPDELAESFAPSGRDLSRATIEAIALEGYRSERLTTGQVRRLLGFETRMQADAFLKEREAYIPYTVEDFEHDVKVALEAARDTEQERREREARERQAG